MSFRMIKAIPLGALGVLLLMLAYSAAAAQDARMSTNAQTADVETYASAAIDSNGNLRITTTDRRTMVVQKEADQSAYAIPRISANGKSVGVVARFVNCCTSDANPRFVLVYSQGRTHRFHGRMITDWQFADEGERLAYGEETVHFSCATFHQLVDIASDRIVEKASVPVPCADEPNPPSVPTPAWVTQLHGKQ
jgi:hypothetical protein